MTRLGTMLLPYMHAMTGKSAPKRHLPTGLLTGLLTALCTKVSSAVRELCPQPYPQLVHKIQLAGEVISPTRLFGPLQPLSRLLLASLCQCLAQDFVENDDPVVDANVL
jgi:hypothetical protein